MSETQQKMSGLIEALGGLSVFEPDDKFIIPECMKDLGVATKPQEVEKLFIQLNLSYTEDRNLFFFKLKLASLKARVEGKKGEDLAPEIALHLLSNGNEYQEALAKAIDKWEIPTPRETLISWDKIVQNEDKDALYYRMIWECGRIISNMDKPSPTHVKNETIRSEFLREIVEKEPRLIGKFGESELDSILRMVAKAFGMSKIVSIPIIGKISQDIKMLLPDPARFSTQKGKPAARPATTTARPAVSSTPRPAGTPAPTYNFKADIGTINMGPAYVPGEMPDFLKDDTLTAEDAGLSDLLDALKMAPPVGREEPVVSGTGVDAILGSITRLEIELENTKEFLAFEQEMNQNRDKVIIHLMDRLNEMRAKAADFQERFNEQLTIRQELEGKLVVLTDERNALEARVVASHEEFEKLFGAMGEAFGTALGNLKL